MPSELQRVAQALLDALDEIPRIVPYLHDQAGRYREAAGWVGSLSRNPPAQQAAMQLGARLGFAGLRHAPMAATGPAATGGDVAVRVRALLGPPLRRRPLAAAVCGSGRGVVSVPWETVASDGCPNSRLAWWVWHEGWPTGHD